MGSVLPPYDPNGGLFPSFAQARQRFLDGGDTPLDYLDRCLAVIEAREPEIRAFAALNVREARRAAEAATGRYREGHPLSPVDGMPIGIKDLLETADMPTESNSPVFKGWSTGRDAASVYALRRGGAIIIGKTVTTEFGVGASGPTRNPWDSERTPGGSSSGSAAAVAAGMVPAALGTQAMGSVIRPSSYCGVVGFKPSFGALNKGGGTSLMPSMGHLGVHAGTLADCWTVAHHIATAAGGDPGHRCLPGGAGLPDARQPKKLVRLFTPGWSEADETTREAFDAFAAELHAAGVDILAGADDPAVAAFEEAMSGALEIWMEICCFEMRWPLAAYRDRDAGLLGERASGFLKRAEAMTVADYHRALERRAGLRDRLAALAGAVDGVIVPAASGPAPLGLKFTGSPAFNALSSGLGAPAISLPLLAVGGLPLGVQLMGFVQGDDRLTAHAAWIAETFRPALLR